jgi:hypothetical protein
VDILMTKAVTVQARAPAGEPIHRRMRHTGTRSTACPILEKNGILLWTIARNLSFPQRQVCIAKVQDRSKLLILKKQIS